MKSWKILLLIISTVILSQCTSKIKNNFNAIDTVINGKPVSVMLTCYSTTLIANGKDHTRIRIAVVDSLMRQISSSSDSVFLYVDGNGTISDQDGKQITYKKDSAGVHYIATKLINGVKYLQYTTGNQPDTVKITARSKGLWEASHELNILPADFRMMKPGMAELIPSNIEVPRMIGADISWLPQLEAKGIKFYEDGKAIDPVQLLAEHGMNFIRLRIFVHPGAPDGYSPGKDFCGLDKTM
ncbi:MAG: glycosyl hydrolase 53 family protein [Bacteroidales bacterium]|nr:glycosyl hydrolase 53 family protein [Bacteroidales bacterium]